MRVLISVVTLLALSACAHEPPALNHPADNAPSWDLNAGRWEGTNKLVAEPTVGSAR